LAGLEQYIAESYDSRSFAELLQNADDAGASRFVIRRTGHHLLVANDGHVFTRSDFESLCRSAASNKERGTSIGFRGIGFKSVVGIAKTIHLFSGELAATFSRERTAHDIPQAKRVPLIRIPHSVQDSERAPFANALDNILGEGLTTVFVFGDLVASGIESEFAAFDPTALLFLRNVRQMELGTTVKEIVIAQRNTVNKRTQNIRLKTSQLDQQWTILTEGGISLAFAYDETGICRLEEQKAVVHAFLPTHEPTGLAIKINGDISTDPSRTRVVLDERTQTGIGQTAQLISWMLEAGLATGKSSLGILPFINALVPTADPRTFAFQRRSFKTELLIAIKKAAQAKVQNLQCRPTWLNAADFEQMAAATGIKIVPCHLEEIDGLIGFLRYLGATEARLDNLLPALTSVSLSVPGCAEIASHLVALYTTKAITPSYIRREWKMWPIEDAVVSLHEATQMAKPLARRFVDMVVERIAGRQEFRRFIEGLTDTRVADALLPEEQAGRALDVTPATLRDAVMGSSSKQRPVTLKRWRNAEQQVLALLTEWEWQVSDVSHQNVGYDIEGCSPEGKPSFIEVKSINYVGEAFTFTSNEEAVARDKRDAYVIALVCQHKDTIEIAFIRDPANRLRFIRQCRQWVWECSEYDFRPETFNVE
jgi:hypothetical protein